MKKTKRVGTDNIYASQDTGITLIALIITIIVMLILVMVSIRIALQTGLFDSAGKATQKWDKEQEREAKLGEGKVTIGGAEYGGIDGYVQSKLECTEHGYADGKCPTCGATSELILGATINYKEYIDPNTNAAFTTMPYYTSEQERNGTCDTTYTVANNSGIEWIVLGEENGQIKITTKAIVQASSGGYILSRGEPLGDYKVLKLQGKNAWMYFTDELHEIGAIYGKGRYADTSKFTVATGGNTGGRSSIIEDLGYNSVTRIPGGTYAKHSDGKIYQYPIGIPESYIREESSTTTLGPEMMPATSFEYLNIDGSNTTNLENREWKSLQNAGDYVTIYEYKYSGSVTTTEDVCETGWFYWLATRCISVNTSGVNFMGYHTYNYGRAHIHNIFTAGGMSYGGSELDRLRSPSSSLPKV